MKYTALMLMALLGLAWSHSWLACSDYRGEVTGLDDDYDEDDCFGYPRDWTSNTLAGIGDFGSDRGYNYQPGGGRTCRNALDGDQDYTDDFPMATYVQGSTVRVLWPAKNHARVRDFGLEIYACCGDDCTDDFENDVDTFTSEGILVADFGTNVNGGSIGFGNCPDVSNTDRAVCFGDFEVPTSLEGECTFVWYWPFNSDQDVYTTCFEADVLTEGTVITPAPTTEAPEEDEEDEDEEEEEEDEEEYECEDDEDPVSIYGQCGGINFGEERCCESGTTCVELNQFYFQCLPETSNRDGDATTEESEGFSGSTLGFSVGAAVLVTGLVGFGLHKRSKKTSSPALINQDNTAHHIAL